MSNITISFLDQFCLSIDTALRTLSGHAKTSERPNPAEKIKEAELTDTEKKHIAGLMRVNHCGEVCAQALYQGQALTAKLPNVRQSMEQAAIEENDHLQWCRNRVQEMNQKTSILDPIYYAGSFALGAIAGISGDKWSLGFVAETEKQVVKHLQSHSQQLPENDDKTRQILETMEQDERQHATNALDAGGADLPQPIKSMMRFTSKIMTHTTYYI